MTQESSQPSVEQPIEQVADHSVEAHRAEADVLMELGEVALTPEDKAVIAGWTAEHVSHAADQVTELKARNRERINLLEPAIEARRKFGTDHH